MKHPNIVLGAALLGMAGAALADQATLGRNMAAACASCHGTDGYSIGGTEPLAGISKDEIIRKLQDFKSGAKPATVMHQIAKGYTDRQIEMIATYFAAQK